MGNVWHCSLSISLNHDIITLCHVWSAGQAYQVDLIFARKYDSLIDII